MRSDQYGKPSSVPGTGGLWFSVVLLVLATLLFMVRGMTPDSDGDGMSDLYEKILGLDQTHHTAAAGVGSTWGGVKK